jgi:LacI family transcriptional regulator
MRNAARDEDYHLLLVDTAGDFQRWDKMDGVVIFPYSSGLTVPRPPQGFPSVTILNEIPGAACVTSNDFDGVHQLARHLIQLGHRRIAYLAIMSEKFSTLQQRKAGYMKALSEAGIEQDARYLRELCEQDEQDELFTGYPLSAEFTMRRWLEEDWAELGCTALIAQNDGVAVGAIRALENAGLQVPRDVSVVGFDGVPLQAGAPLITTIEVPLQEIGRQAVASLLEWIKDPAQTPRNICLPNHLIEGRTTAPPPGVVSKHALVTA